MVVHQIVVVINTSFIVDHSCLSMFLIYYCVQVKYLHIYYLLIEFFPHSCKLMNLQYFTLFLSCSLYCIPIFFSVLFFYKHNFVYTFIPLSLYFLL